MIDCAYRGLHGMSIVGSRTFWWCGALFIIWSVRHIPLVLTPMHMNCLCFNVNTFGVPMCAQLPVTYNL